MTLKTQIINWWQKNKFHRGKWTMIERIVDDLELEFITNQFAGVSRNYKWNIEVMEILNSLIDEKKLIVGVSGRAYTYTWEEK